MNRLIIPINQTDCLTADLRSASVHTLERPPKRARLRLAGSPRRCYNSFINVNSRSLHPSQPSQIGNSRGRVEALRNRTGVYYSQTPGRWSD